MSFWKILRVLVSDVCNYQCVFCHNEGQNKIIGKGELMQFDKFYVLIDALRNSGITDIEFSGGEPFTNPETIKMIELVNSTTSWEIGCATNAQLINEEIAKRLGETRTKININLPSLDERKFKSITITGHLEKLFNQLSMFEKYNVDYAFNSVLGDEGLEEIMSMIDFVSMTGKRLKILPFLDMKQPAHHKDADTLFQYLDQLAETSTFQPTSRKWALADRGKGKSFVKYVEFPCFDYNNSACREYAEVRILPDFSIQPCLVNQDFRYPLSLYGDGSREQILGTFEKAWANFINC